MFATVRGIDALGLTYKLPTTEGFYNIFHPYDPVAYRIEALVNLELANVRPVLVPHHKGRKRMHIELRETMARVSADIKHKILETYKTTMNTVCNFALLQKTDPKGLQQEVNKVRVFCVPDIFLRRNNLFNCILGFGSTIKIRSTPRSKYTVGKF